MNQDGKYAAKEVEIIVRDVLEERAQTKGWKRIAGVLFVAFLVLCGWLIAGVYIGNEASKEQKIPKPNNVPVAKAAGTSENVRTQNAEQFVHVAIDGDAMIAAKMSDATSQLVEVGQIKKKYFLDTTNNVKQASRKGMATVTKCSTVFYYDYQVRSLCRRL